MITHGNKHAKFLGYEIYVRKFSDMTKRGEKSGNLIKVYGKKVVLEMPMEAMKKKLLYYEVMRIHQFEIKRNGNRLAGQRCFIMTTLRYWTLTMQK